MQEKLTLNIDGELLEKVRARAEARGVSVSDLLSHYLATLVREEATESERSKDQTTEAPPGEAFGPITRSLGAKPEREVTEEDYRRHLGEKHQ